MRLWHWKLIPYLPNQQLLGQWRECNAIARDLYDRGEPNHILVNPVVEYPMEEFLGYCKRVYKEMIKRGYQVLLKDTLLAMNGMTGEGPFFEHWHNDRYLIQCFYNLQEKYDRGGIPYRDWIRIQMFMNDTGLIPHDVVG